MKKFLKRFFIALLILFVVIQFFRIDKSVPSHDPSGDFLVMYKTDQKTTDLLKNACYDCHSYQSSYPWYAEIAPISWRIANHIEEGREELNFSEWSSYTSGKQKDKLNECVEEIRNGNMPDPGYVKMHAEADLNPQDKELLISYFQSIRDTVNSDEEQER